MQVWQENIKDHRVTSREMYLNPILSFLYWKMEYHLTHHMFPNSSVIQFGKLHHHIKDQLPKPNDGLIDAYKEIIPALIKQKEDTSYFIKKELPQASKHLKIYTKYDFTYLFNLDKKLYITHGKNYLPHT